MKKDTSKQHSPRIEIAVSVLILSLVIGGVFLLFMPKKEKITPSPTTSSEEAIAPPVTDSIDSIDSNYPGIKIITEISNDEKTPFALQYPQSIHSTFNEETRAYIKEVRDDYLKNMAEYKRLGGELSGELNISFETFSHHSGMYSFVLVNSTYTGGANGSTEIVSLRLNPKTGKQITIEDVFDHDQDKLADLSTIVREELLNDNAIQDYLFEDELELYTKPIWANFKNFALTNDSIIFYFDKYKIAAGVAGVPIVSIPIESINELISSDFKQLNSSIADKPEETDDKPDDTENKNPDKDGLVEESDSNEELEIPNKKQVALTFDDGPNPKITTKILATLKKYDAKATFFMLGSRVEYYPETAKDVEKAGHELGNHTWNHPDLTKASVKKINNEITSTSSIIEDVTGKKATVFRPPYGAANDTVRAQTDLPVTLWDVDTLDWKHRNPDQLLAYVKKSTKDGSIVLMHDIHQSTADGLEDVLSYLKSEGYTFVTVSELN